MIGRCCKHIFNQSLYNLIIQYKKVKASTIQDEIVEYVIQLFNSVVGNNKDRERVNRLINHSTTMIILKK